MAQASCVLAFGLPLLLRVENYGEYEYRIFKREEGAWEHLWSAEDLPYCLRAKVCVCV